MRGQCRPGAILRGTDFPFNPGRVNVRGTSGEVADDKAQYSWGQAVQGMRTACFQLIEQFLGDEDVAEHAGECDDSDHLQDDTNAGYIATNFTESTTNE